MPRLPSTGAALFFAGVAFGIGLAGVLSPRARRRLGGVLRWSRAERARPAAAGARKTLVATRIHAKHQKAVPSLEPLRAFLTRALELGDAVAVAVGADGKHGEALVVGVRHVRASFPAEDQARIEVIPVTPWGSFVPGLHALVGHACRMDFDALLLASVEVVVDAAAVGVLQRALSLESDLVAGAALPGHEFEPGLRPLTGRTTPWNTLALWNVQLLAQTGFPGVAEGWVYGTGEGGAGRKAIAPGVEEASAIALLQALKPGAARAKLVRVPGVAWSTTFSDPERRAWHERKMQSKLERAAQHLGVLGVGGATVEHLVAT